MPPNCKVWNRQFITKRTVKARVLSIPNVSYFLTKQCIGRSVQAPDNSIVSFLLIHHGFLSERPDDMVESCATKLRQGLEILHR